MAQVKDSIQKFGKRKYKTDDLKEILRRLEEDGISDQFLAEKFDATVPAIRHWKKKFGLLDPRPRFPEWVKEQGYKDYCDFFRKNAGKTFKQLAKESGYCYVTVSTWYHAFAKETGFERA